MARNWDFPAGIEKWVRNQPQLQVLSCFFSVSFLKPVRAGSGPFTSHFMDVDLGNCNLQDEFLPSPPQKTPWGIKHTPTPAQSTHSPPCCAWRHQQHPPGGGTKNLGAEELPRDKERDRRHRGVGAAQVSLLLLCCGGGRVCSIAAPRQR